MPTVFVPFSIGSLEGVPGLCSFVLPLRRSVENVPDRSASTKRF